MKQRLNLTLSYKQIELINELQERGSCNLLRGIVKGVELADFQQVTVAYAYIVKYCLISLDTGLGKTLVATGLINFISQLHPGKKWIFAVQNSNLESTYKKVKSGVYGLRVMWSDANSKEVVKRMLSVDLDTYDVFVLSYQAVCNKYLNDYLYDVVDKFHGIIIDESHMLSNYTGFSAKMLGAVMQKMEYRYMLTATPVRVSPCQVINQIYMLDPKMFDGVSLQRYRNFFLRKEDGRITGFQNLDELSESISPRYIGITRSELGLKGKHTPIVILCEPKEEYRKLRKSDIFRRIKGDWDGPTMRAAKDFILSRADQGQKGVMYVNLIDNKDLLKRYLERYGIKVGILDGAHTPTSAMKEMVHSNFVNGMYDVLLTNITTGRDLQCNFIAFYELTFDFVQFVGRGERGLTGNDLDIVFFLAKDTEEITYFVDNVLERGLLLESVSQKDLKALKDAYRLVVRGIGHV